MSDKPGGAVLITGASRGIGLACARALDARGSHVVGFARSTSGEDFPGDLYAVDLSDRRATQDALSELDGRYAWAGLINNVGAVAPQRIEEVRLGTLDRVVQVNLGAAILCAQFCIPAMRQRGAGRIVNISSELALGLPTRTAYAGTKAALISMTRTWALELAPDNITVNAVAPGAVDTELFRANNPEGGAEWTRKLTRIPLGRFGRPEDIAKVVGFLMSDDAGYMTGQTLFVDGGSSLGATSLF